MFNVNNIVIRCYYCYLCTYFTPFSGVFIVNFKQVDVSWVKETSYSKKADLIRFDRSKAFLTIIVEQKGFQV